MYYDLLKSLSLWAYGENLENDWWLSMLLFETLTVPNIVLILSVQKISYKERIIPSGPVPWTAACQASLPITICQSLLKLMSIVSSVTIHSSVDTYLGCFHALVIVTNTTMNVDVWMPFWHTDFIFFACEVGLQDYIEVLLWFSWGIAVVVSIVPVPVYIPAKCTRDPFSPHPHHKFYLFDDRHLNRYDVIAQCGFDLLFLRD